MANEPLVSVVIIFLDAEPFIVEAIESNTSRNATPVIT